MEMKHLDELNQFAFESEKTLKRRMLKYVCLIHSAIHKIPSNN